MSRGYGRYHGHLAHRFVWLFTYGPIPDGLCVAHSCDTRVCVRPDHLFVGPQRANLVDAIQKGRVIILGRKGEENPSAKLTTDQVRDILALRGKRSQQRLGQQFGVAPTTISKIQRRKSWSHLSDLVTSEAGTA